MKQDQELDSICEWRLPGLAGGSVHRRLTSTLPHAQDRCAIMEIAPGRMMVMTMVHMFPALPQARGRGLRIKPGTGPPPGAVSHGDGCTAQAT